MADFNQINQFGSAKPARSGEGTSCAECEAMLMDALDGTLSAKQKAAFDRHIATCSECSQMLADAKRGAVLLEMLKAPRPEPSSLLLDRILSQTSGFAVPVKSAAQNSAAVAAIPAADADELNIHAVPAVPANVIPFRPRAVGRFSLKSITQTMMQPRLAMTAAMAFFSITLTLNLTGVHLSELKASDLTPANLKHSFYHANASVVRYYDNLRVVYELESRVNEIKHSSESDNPPAAAKPSSKDDGDKSPQQDKPRKAPKSGSGTSERRGLEDHRGFAERNSPLAQGFKFASYHGNRFLPETGFGNTARAARLNKLKETSQEGDLV